MPEQKNFINFHVLISHSPSCLNRDDQNMQKRAVFGGVERIRISSQSLKRAMRKSGYYQKNIGDPSIRSNKLEKLIAKFSDELKDKYSPELIRKAVDSLPAKQRMATILQVYEGLSYKEVSRILGCSVKSVERRLYWARTNLKKKLSSYLTRESGGGF